MRQIVRLLKGNPPIKNQRRGKEKKESGLLIEKSKGACFSSEKK